MADSAMKIGKELQDIGQTLIDAEAPPKGAGVTPVAKQNVMELPFLSAPKGALKTAKERLEGIEDRIDALLD